MTVIPFNLARVARLERQTETETVVESPIDVPEAEQQRSADRRGPLRPGKLLSARARVSGYAMARVFRFTDLMVIFACAMLARPWTATEGVSGTAVTVLGVTLAVLLGLNLARAYDFNRHEGLAFHLARLAAAVALTGAAAFGVMVVTNGDPKLWESIGLWLCQ